MNQEIIEPLILLFVRLLPIIGALSLLAYGYLDWRLIRARRECILSGKTLWMRGRRGNYLFAAFLLTFCGIGALLLLGFGLLQVPIWLPCWLAPTLIISGVATLRTADRLEGFAFGKTS